MDESIGFALLPSALPRRGFDSGSGDREAWNIEIWTEMVRLVSVIVQVYIARINFFIL